ncbi:hypothetical protein C1752_02767 [Acaryochloris thomasi RCC1774]|uniref:DUF1211 domain-containing protein n=1 Tax=Acaryochloris thomasi RCC1774 TaxID=1764569 RepID=A0A2W1JIB7_9CYAN|nr:TMEM175 family protein [Acaryochloris thomasi]PZD73046.1 hypothetical protein C1752_02767 [Acaryochloris thomasi RCC1774]
MKKEHLGAFIDAVYAISITMLALDIPVEIEAHDLATLQNLLAVFIQYCLSFVMLFGFWLQHRQVNHYLPLSRFSLWISAALLLITTLIPRVTTLVYEHGAYEHSAQSGNLLQFNFSEAIDIIFIVTIVIADALLGQLVLRLKSPADASHPDSIHIRQMRKSKAVITASLVAMTVAILLIPPANRNLLWLIAVLIFLQNDVGLFLDSLPLLRRRPSSRTVSPNHAPQQGPSLDEG